MKTILSKISVTALLSLIALAAAGQATEATRLDTRNSSLYRPIDNSKRTEQVEVMKPMSRAEAMNNRLRAPLANPTRPSSNKVTSRADVPNLRGAVIFADSWSENNHPYGLYDINPTACEMFIEGVNANDGGVLVDNKTFYAHQLEEDIFGFNLYVKGYDVATGKKSFDDYAFSANRAAADITYDPSSGNVYGIFWKDDDMTGYQLASITYNSTLKVTPIMDLPGDWCAIAADPEGMIYLVRREIKDQKVVSSKLYVLLDSEQGLVGSVGGEDTLTGALPLYMSSMTFDERSGKLLWNVSTQTGSAIYELDPSTGKATKLYDLPDNEEIMGLYVIYSNEADNGIPAPATDLTANFSMGALTGTLTFTAPAVDKNKAPLSGSLNYVVTVDDIEVAKGTCDSGDKIEVPITLTASGNHKFEVMVSNDKGTAEVAIISFYAGFATPMPPRNVVMTINDGKATVTWDKVTEPMTKGYFDAEKITYNVTRNPGAVEVLSGTTETTFTEPLVEPDGYTVYNYIITAVHNGVKSSPAKSNSYSVGTIEPPYIEEFSDASSLDGFTTVKWKYDSKQGCAYLPFGTPEDWLFTPGIKLEGGKTYNFSVDMACYSSWSPENFEIKYGTSPDGSAMTSVIIESTEIKNADFATHNAEITPTADGIYYIGIHSLMKENWYLYVDNLRVDAAFDNDMPAEINDFVATGDPNGLIKVNISLTAPSATFKGAPLESIDRIEIKRGEKLIHTFASPKPGEKLSFVDTTPDKGENTYTAISYSGYSVSLPAKATAFAGFDTPSMPEGLTVTETSDGVLTVSWDKVTTGTHGGPINPDLITYDVATFDGLNMDIAEYGIEEGPVTFRAVQDGQQEYIQVIVFPIIQSLMDDDEIEGEPAMSKMIPVGTPAGNYRESFAGGLYSTTLGLDLGKQSSVEIYNNDGKTTAQDDDNGFIAVHGTAVGATSAFMTGKINLSGMAKPSLTFYSFTIVDPNNGNPSQNKVDISVALPGEEFTPVLSTSVSEISPEAGWHLVTVPLDAYVGKTIIVSFRGTTINQQFTLFDNLRIGSSLDNDIAITQISAPSRCNAGADYSVNVLFENTGVKEADNFGIALYQDDKLVEEKSAGKLSSGATGALRFDVTMHPLATQNIALKAKVVYDADMNIDNDESNTVEVRPIVSKLPIVTDLSGQLVNSKAALTWSEPAFDQYGWSEPITESFENGKSFAKEFEGWTFIDNDKQPTGTFKQFDMPGIENNSLQSFWIFDSTLPALGQYASGFSAFAGDKFLAAMYTRPDGDGNPTTNDDWAISPELSGDSQFVSFYARSYSSSVSEAFEVLYSTTGTDLESFESALKVNIVPRAWTFYEIELPAGARYFAVRYCASDAMMLMLDHFTFTPKGTPGTLALEGFNVYRNNELLNETPVGDFEFTDEKPLAKESSYVVTAVYTQGESAGSNAIVLDTSGIENVENGAVTVVGLTGKIVITGAEGEDVAVFNTTGVKMVEEVGEASMTINIGPGIYIVTVGDLTVKTIVK